MPFLGRSSNQAAAWIQVFIAFDRYIFVAFPKRFQFVQTRKFILVCVLANYLVAWLLHLPNLLFYLQSTETTVTENNKTLVKITYSCVASKAIVSVRDNISSIFRCYLPLLFIVVGNHLLIRSFRRSKQRFAEKAENSSSTTGSTGTGQQPISAKKGSKKKEQSFFNAIIGMDMIYIITLIPQVIIITVLTILDNLSSFSDPKLLIVIKSDYYI